MEDFIQKLTKLLDDSFLGAEFEWEPASERRVGGLMIWNGFDGLDQSVRQRSVWKVIRDKLAADEQLRISAILTLTPEEMASAREA
jgi:hypothetical protein